MKCLVFMKALGVAGAGLEGHGCRALRASALSKCLPATRRNATPFQPGIILLQVHSIFDLVDGWLPVVLNCILVWWCGIPAIEADI